MGKTLNFVLGENTFPLAPTKIERKKLYGWTEIRATDPDGNICRQASLDSNGVTVIPKGAMKMGAITEDGNWMEKSELEAQHADGTKAELIPSSFDGEIKLNRKVDADYLLDHIISSVYQLEGDSAADLIKKIGTDIYAFPFNYRTDYSCDDGMLISNGQTLFVFVGQRAQFEYIGLEEQKAIDEPDEEVMPEVDDLDFSMF